MAILILCLRIFVTRKEDPVVKRGSPGPWNHVLCCRLQPVISSIVLYGVRKWQQIMSETHHEGEKWKKKSVWNLGNIDSNRSFYGVCF